jgi:DNA-binding PucR family transcriptional regulator
VRDGRPGIDPLLAALLSDLTDSLAERSLEVSRELHREIPELGDDPETFEITRASAEANLGAVLTVVRSAIPLAEIEPPLAAVEFARELVRRGVPLEALLRAYRLGTSWIWQVWTRELAQRVDDEAHRAELMETCMTASFGYMDRVADQIAAEYAAERERWVRTAAAVRAGAVQALLDPARGDEAGIEDTERRLGYRLRHRTHVALMLWARTPPQDAVRSSLEAAAAALGAALGEAAVLCVPGADGGLWAWLGVAGACDLDALAGAAARRPELAGVVVAAGAPGRGVEGFRASHAQAAHARHLALLLPAPPDALLRYSDVALPALLSHHLDDLRAFIAAELGPLAGTDAMSARLRETLDLFLEHGGRTAAPAQILGVHHNTVAYRVRRAAELLGRPVGERRFELEAALRMVRLFGEQVLADPDGAGPPY